MRLFIAIDLDNAIRKRISDYISQLQRDLDAATNIKFVRAESLHLTLKFIGENNHIDEITTALRLVAARSFQLTLRDVGFFTPRSPRIFWAGVHAPLNLAQLANTIDAALFPLGIPLEEHEYHPQHEYHPHITLARSGSGRPPGEKGERKPSMLGLQQAIASQPELSNPDFGTMTPREYFLFRSETLPEGARYTKLARFPLQ